MNKLNAARGPAETYSEAILRIAREEAEVSTYKAEQALKVDQPLVDGASLASAATPSMLVSERP
jgi:hypothetical protein